MIDVSSAERSIPPSRASFRIVSTMQLLQLPQSGNLSTVSSFTYRSSKSDGLSEELCARAYNVFVNLVHIRTAGECKVRERSGKEQSASYEFQ
jgi:hypothetical protein